jgi:hypothetical protein
MDGMGAFWANLPRKSPGHWGGSISHPSPEGGNLMPLFKHFQGHGATVMASMRNAHPDYSEDRLKEMFYATENARKKKRKAMLHGSKHGR